MRYFICFRIYPKARRNWPCPLGGRVFYVWHTTQSRDRSSTLSKNSEFRRCGLLDVLIVTRCPVIGSRMVMVNPSRQTAKLKKSLRATVQ
jgi:hypothetical protein